jgi:hypothetical protein
MHPPSSHRERGRVSGLVVFIVAMAALVLAIALGANSMFTRSFGPTAGGETVPDRTASGAAAGSAVSSQGAASTSR